MHNKLSVLWFLVLTHCLCVFVKLLTWPYFLVPILQPLFAIWAHSVLQVHLQAAADAQSVVVVAFGQREEANNDLPRRGGRGRGHVHHAARHEAQHAPQDFQPSSHKLARRQLYQVSTNDKMKRKVGFASCICATCLSLLLHECNVSYRKQVYFYTEDIISVPPPCPPSWVYRPNRPCQ